jgi:hypothetical protein
MSRPLTFVMSLIAVIGLTWLWHDPLGAGDDLASRVERQARAQLDRDEMTQVQARLQRGPLTRRLILSGPADDFQRREIVRRLEDIPGVGEARWDAGSLETESSR